jgi:hypothetical protein
MSMCLHHSNVAIKLLYNHANRREGFKSAGSSTIYRYVSPEAIQIKMTGRGLVCHVSIPKSLHRVFEHPLSRDTITTERL